MGLENGKWRVVRGDCLWNIAKSVYNNPYKWPDIAKANGISQKNPIIYPGQLFVLPGITPGTQGSPPPSPKPAPPTARKVRVDWFSLSAGTQRNMECLWVWSGEQRFWVKWEYYDSNGHKWVQSETQDYKTTTGEIPQAQCNYGEEAKKCRISIRPVTDNIVKDEHGNQHVEGIKYQDNTDWEIKEYDFANNPPNLPPDPDFSIDNQNNATISFRNIDKDLNAYHIEIAIYQDDQYKYKTLEVYIDYDAGFASVIEPLDPGHRYKVKARGVRLSSYGGWTNFTENQLTLPIAPKTIKTLRPQKISEQQSVTYGVLVEWDAVETAKQYEIQWTTQVEYFDTNPSEVSSQTTSEEQGTRALITNIEVGHEYFFRVASINDKGRSANWSEIRSVVLGTKPSAPTTWSNVTSAVIGEDINLYWRHNSTDGSLETYARIKLEVRDSAHPELAPTEYTKVIQNTRPEEERDQNGVYTINTNDPEWSGLLSEGFVIKWKVQTAGVIGEYSDYSTEREINVYRKPTLELDIINNEAVSSDEVNGYPFYFKILAEPATQIPISYYIEVISNDGYSIIDKVGQIKYVNPGDKVYQKYYDPDTNAWLFVLELTPAIIDLSTNANYTVNVTVAMDSGLSATVSKDFDVILNDTGYNPYAKVFIDKETLTASIQPYCMVNYEEDGEILERLADNCSVSVYRREYDGTFTEIATNIPNSDSTYVMDPHPALDYARYRIVSIANDTGTISYIDVDPVEVDEPAIVIQWAEEWSMFDYDSETDSLEVPWAGSLIKLPYNVDVSEDKDVDVSLIEYVGRKHPVSYYGTQIGETASWSTQIPMEDKELLYSLRRLSRWTGDVYVREPSGTGYWANIKVSLNIEHLAVTIPVSLSVTRVEGGM